MAEQKTGKPTPSAIKNAQSMYDHFIHGSKISLIAVIATLVLLGLVFIVA